MFADAYNRNNKGRCQRSTGFEGRGFEIFFGALPPGSFPFFSKWSLNSPSQKCNTGSAPVCRDNISTAESNDNHSGDTKCWIQETRARGAYAPLFLQIFDTFRSTMHDLLFKISLEIISVIFEGTVYMGVYNN